MSKPTNDELQAVVPAYLQMDQTKVLRLAQRLQRAEALLRLLHASTPDAQVRQAVTVFFDETQRRNEQ